MVKNYESRVRRWVQSLDGRFFENPIAAYLILKRLSEGWIEIEDLMRNTAYQSKLDPASFAAKF